MPWIARLMSGKLQPSRGRYGVLRIALNPLDKDPFLVADAAAVLRARVSPPPVAGWHPGMDDESIDVLLESAYLTDNPDRLSPEQVLSRLEALAPRMKKITDRLLGIR